MMEQSHSTAVHTRSEHSVTQYLGLRTLVLETVSCGLLETLKDTEQMMDRGCD